MYLNHIYQLAASARSVVAENKMLRLRLEASKKSAATLVRSNYPSSSPTIVLLLCLRPWLQWPGRENCLKDKPPGGECQGDDTAHKPMTELKGQPELL